MKVVALILALLLAVASAQFSVSFTYKGSADCSDATKVISILVEPGACTPSNCQSQSITRCYAKVSDIPIPSNAITLQAWASNTCDGNPSGAQYQIPGLAGCLPDAGGSSYFAGCNTTSSGAMTCEGNADCSANCVRSVFYAAKENECGTVNALSNKFTCTVDTSIFGTSSPTASTGPSVAPAAGPARKSSATQIVSGIGAVASLVALAL